MKKILFICLTLTQVLNSASSAQKVRCWDELRTIFDDTKIGKTKACEALCKKNGIDAAIYVGGRTLLDCAIRLRNDSAVRLLLQWGADVNSYSNGYTPLHTSILTGSSISTIALLREHPDIDINRRTDDTLLQWTPLMCTINKDDGAYIGYLGNADLSLTAPKNVTILHQAADTQRHNALWMFSRFSGGNEKEVLKQLVKTKTTDTGETPFHYALHFAHDPIFGYDANKQWTVIKGPEYTEDEAFTTVCHLLNIAGEDAKDILRVRDNNSNSASDLAYQRSLNSIIRLFKSLGICN